MVTRVRRLALFSMVACGASVLGAQAAPAADGWTVTIAVGDSAAKVPTQMKAYASGDKVRMDVGQANPQMAGAFMLWSAHDTATVFVLPAQQMIVRGPAGLAGPMARLVKLDASVVGTPSLEDLGAGDVILGHATRRFRTTTTIEMKATVATSSCTLRSESVNDDLIATDLPDVLGSLSLKMAAATLGGQTNKLTEELDKVRARLPKGLSMRSVVKISRSRDGAAPVVSTSKTEVTSIVHAPVDTTLFTPPAGYNEVDPAAMMSGISDDMLQQVLAAQAPMMLNAICNGRVGAP